MIPEAVKKQAEEAARIAAEMADNSQDTPAEDGGPDLSENGQDTNLSTDSSQEYSNSNEPAQENMQEPEDWEQKYKVLQGKYNAEVPRLHEEIKGLKQSNDFLAGKLELLEKLVAENQQNQPQQATPVDDRVSSINEEDPEIAQFREDFPEIYKGVKKLVEQILAKQVEVENKIKNTEETLAQTTTQMFYTQLANLVPDWETLNTSADFLKWLQVIEPFTGVTRHELMNKAFSQGDAVGVAKFFLAFKDEQARMNSNTNQQQQQQSISPPAGRASKVGFQNQNSSRTYKQSEIEEFYRQMALGRVPADEAKAKEMEFLKAMKEGRILYNQ